jgi:hypothetical protein
LHALGQFVLLEFAVAILVVLHQTAEQIAAAGATRTTVAALRTRTTKATIAIGAHAAFARPTETGTARAAEALRTQFITGQFAIVVLVEFLERSDGALDFLLVNRAVAVGVKRLHHGHHGPAAGTAETALAIGATGSALTFGTAGATAAITRATLAGRRTIGFATAGATGPFVILGNCSERRERQGRGNRQGEFAGLHSVVSWG